MWLKHSRWCPVSRSICQTAPSLFLTSQTHLHIYVKGVANPRPALYDLRNTVLYLYQTSNLMHQHYIPTDIFWHLKQKRGWVTKILLYSDITRTNYPTIVVNSKIISRGIISQINHWYHLNEVLSPPICDLIDSPKYMLAFAKGPTSLTQRNNKEKQKEPKDQN